MNHQPISETSNPTASRELCKQNSSELQGSAVCESWQLALFNAISQTDRTRALPLIRRAQAILERRLTEIASNQQSPNSAEVGDLWSALTYLGILLECALNERGKFLWE